MEYFNFTDNFIEDFFQNHDINSKDFFKDISENIKNSQKGLTKEIEKLEKENEMNAEKVDETKQAFFEKLEQTTNLYNNFEFRTNQLSRHYNDKLSYIAVLSKSLGEYENFQKNIKFAEKIFNYLEILNKENENGTITLPDIFIQPEKMLEEGVEIYQAFTQLVNTCKRDFPIFAKNFNLIETKMKETIQESISEFYDNNQLDKLEQLMKVTERMNSDFIIDIYVKYVTDNMKLVYNMKRIQEIDFRNFNEIMLNEVIELVKEFHETIIKGCENQFGRPSSKIFLIFPKSKQQIIISNLVLKLTKIISEFRKSLISENDKTDEVFVKLVEFIYPYSKLFVQRFKESLAYCQSDLWNIVDQETSMFLRGIEAIYMYKEKNILDHFVQKNYIENIKKISNIKKEYEMNSSKQIDTEIKVDQFQSAIFDVIHSTNFSIIGKFATEAIGRYFILLGKDEEKRDMTETLLKNILDTIRDLLISYASVVRILIYEREKHRLALIEPHYFIFSKLNFLCNDFQHIFLYDLKDFFRNLKLFEEVEDSVVDRVKKINIAIDQLFSQISSFTTGHQTNLLKAIKYKDIYNIGKRVDSEYAVSSEIERVLNAIRPLLASIIDSWPDVYKKKISLLITKIISDKMIELLKNAKFTESGVKMMMNDFSRIRKTFCEYLDEFYYNQINDIVLLSEVFNLDKDEVDKFISGINVVGDNKKLKYDEELLKIIAKKRKAMK